LKTLYKVIVMKMNMLKAAMAVALLAVGVNAYAAKQSATINPTVTVGGTCTIDTTGLDVNFGTYAVGTTSATTAGLSAGNVAVTCANGLAYKIGFNAGNHHIGDGYRRMFPIGAAATNIAYDIKVGGANVGDVGLNAIDGSYTDTMPAGYPAIAGTGTGAAQTTAVTFDLLLSGAEADTYQDTVAVTVVW
jgi:spore coat protein U-like protein